jgi:hypothetical protein
MALPERYVCGANLTALGKKDKSLRPIACGDVWRQLAGRCACKDFADRFRESLAPHQFRVAVPGTEILVHAARFLFEGSVSKSDFYVLKFDFKNAFNSAGVLRSGCGAFPQFPFLRAPSALLFGERELLGDPLRPLLFCLSIHRLSVVGWRPLAPR